MINPAVSELIVSRSVEEISIRKFIYHTQQAKSSSNGPDNSSL